MNMKYKKTKRTEYIFFPIHTHAQKTSKNTFFHVFIIGSSSLYAKNLVEIFFSHTVIQLWVVGVCPTTMALASKKYSSRLSNSNTIFQFNKLTKKRYEYTRTEKRVAEPRERRKKGEIKSLKLQVRWKERKIIHTLYALTAHCTTTVAVWQYTV